MFATEKLRRTCRQSNRVIDWRQAWSLSRIKQHHFVCCQVDGSCPTVRGVFFLSQAVGSTKRCPWADTILLMTDTLYGTKLSVDSWRKMIKHESLRVCAKSTSCSWVCMAGIGLLDRCVRHCWKVVLQIPVGPGFLSKDFLCQRKKKWQPPPPPHTNLCLQKLP